MARVPQRQRTPPSFPPTPILVILSEPPPTQVDLHFRVGPFPVRVSPWFWAAALLTGLPLEDPKLVLLWTVVLFFSILVHELGHTIVQRWFGEWPRIVLHGMGGLAIADGRNRTPRSQILISLAGPAAGFLAAALLILIVALTSRGVVFQPLFLGPVGALPAVDKGASLFFGNFYWVGYGTTVDWLISQLLFVNVVWGLVNLLPIYPLDGGQVARELFTLGRNPRQGIVNSLWLSTIAAGGMAIYGLLAWKSLLVVLLFGYLAYSSYRNLEAYTGRGPGAGWR